MDIRIRRSPIARSEMRGKLRRPLPAFAALKPGYTFSLNFKGRKNPLNS